MHWIYSDLIFQKRTKKEMRISTFRYFIGTDFMNESIYETIFLFQINMHVLLNQMWTMYSIFWNQVDSFFSSCSSNIQHSPFICECACHELHTIADWNLCVKSGSNWYHMKNSSRTTFQKGNCNPRGNKKAQTNLEKSIHFYLKFSAVKSPCIVITIRWILKMPWIHECFSFLHHSGAHGFVLIRMETGKMDGWKRENGWVENLVEKGKR